MKKIILTGSADALNYALKKLDYDFNLKYVFLSGLSLDKPFIYSVSIYDEPNKNLCNTIDNIVSFLYNEKKLILEVKNETDYYWIPRNKIR